MATDLFAKLGDIKGESLDAQHKDEIEVLSFSWGVSNTGSSRSGGGGSGTGKAVFQDLHVHRRRQRHSRAPEGVRDRTTHQGRDDHPPQGG